MRMPSISPLPLARAGAVLAAGLCAALAACSPYSPDLSGAPFFCGSNEPKCPHGFTCMASGSGQDVCVAPGGMAPDAGGDPSCNIDQNLEPNDTLQQAFVTTIEDGRASIDLAGLAICPSTDKDTYEVTITTANDNLEMTMSYDAAGAPLQASILSASGTPLATGSPMGTDTVHGWAPNLPVGTYYVQVAIGSTGMATTNTYKLKLVTCTTPMSTSSCTM